MRQIVALTAVAALLVSNFAGIVHVGQHLISANAGENGSVAPGDEDSNPSLTCNCHSHRSTVDSAGDNENDTAPKDHDSDSCSICQSYLASRVAVVDSPVSVVPADATPSSVVFSLASDPSWPIHRGTSVRGPPLGA